MAKRDLPDWLVVARANNYGLTRDAQILIEAMRAAGLSAEFSPRKRWRLLDLLLGRKAARRVLQLERASWRWFSAGSENWIMPNQERYPLRHLNRLKRATGVFAKTRHAERIFSNLGVRTIHVGFTSEDRFDPAVEKDWNKFLHLAGGSTLKGTEDVLALWASHPEWPELVLVQKADNAPREVPANVRLLSGYIDDAELRRLQNECGIHLCPSRAEGWGHNIVEALSTGACVVATDAPPMNEFVTAENGIPVRYSRQEPRHLGTCFFVDRAALEQAIASVLAMTEEDKRKMGRAARATYDATDKEFRARARDVFPMR
ncbi:glycosyltransferase [Pseudaminobacter salicylatoxidans]|uniref:glycosyltransferase n=1 Tax=Pseudaminobacter salicylatoxidans TaxID=93369 RepID=UPI0002FFEB9A|nr:glycosyltransferase [Pseudaminobacter salicylatoxidans]